MFDNTSWLSTLHAGRYRIERRLADGGLDTDDLAEHPKRRRTVAPGMTRPGPATWLARAAATRNGAEIA